MVRQLDEPLESRFDLMTRNTAYEYVQIIRLVHARDQAQEALVTRLRWLGFDPERPIRFNDATLTLEQDPVEPPSAEQ